MEKFALPLIDLTLPKGAFSRSQLQALEKELLDIVLRWERADSTAHAKEISWIYAHEVEVMHALVGDSVPGKPHYRVDVAVPAGTMDEHHRAGLIYETTRAVLTADGSPFTDADAMRVWVILREVDEGSWGMGGRALGCKDIMRYAVKATLPVLTENLKPVPREKPAKSA
ncbi:tautomerase family protein [Paraburkholderia sp. C35]|uniref:tautomerase family protein n=1 Tax=Paraburkholderia sp. C35 TaxID=2126993 RepID=UPI000D69A6C3|nr:tautomerase family protein [Paraburkholderia sp. C35]